MVKSDIVEECRVLNLYTGKQHGRIVDLEYK